MADWGGKTKPILGGSVGGGGRLADEPSGSHYSGGLHPNPAAESELITGKLQGT